MVRTSRSRTLIGGTPAWPRGYGRPRSAWRTTTDADGRSRPSPGLAAADGRSWPPGGELLAGSAALPGASGELLTAEGGEADPEGRVDLGVPLLHPRLQLGQPCNQRHQPLISPALGLPSADD